MGARRCKRNYEMGQTYYSDRSISLVQEHLTRPLVEHRSPEIHGFQRWTKNVLHCSFKSLIKRSFCDDGLTRETSMLWYLTLFLPSATGAIATLVD